MKTDVNDVKNDPLIAELKKLVPVCEKLESTPADDPIRASVVANIQAQVDEFVDNVATLCSRHEARDFAMRIKQHPSDGRLLLCYIQKHETKIAELEKHLAAQK